MHRRLGPVTENEANQKEIADYLVQKHGSIVNQSVPKSWKNWNPPVIKELVSRGILRKNNNGEIVSLPQVLQKNQTGKKSLNALGKNFDAIKTKR